MNDAVHLSPFIALNHNTRNIGTLLSSNVELEDY